jgi:hypothetical protein
MNACTPRGHNFAPIRQFGQRYSFILDVDPLALSRLVRDHACAS